jgi:hypothetical protein
LAFSTTISVVMVAPEAPLALSEVSSMAPASRVSTRSTRSPGVMKPPTPAISSVLTVTARIPGDRRLDKVARPFGPESLASSTGSFASTGERTTRLPSASNLSMVAKAPCGSESCGQGISESWARSSGMPKRKGAVATTMVLNSTLGEAGTGMSTDISWTRAPAALLIQRSAAKIDAAPTTAAMPIIVIALPLTPCFPYRPAFCSSHA